MENNGRTLILILLGAIVLAFGAFIYYNSTVDDDVRSDINDDIEEANDIEREVENTTAWVLATTTDYSFEYPDDLDLEYVELVDWPPEVQLTADEFACEEGGAETDRAGRTDLVTVGGYDYCRTTIVEGAAGSEYRQYAYTFPFEDGTAIMTMSTRTPQCANYEADEMKDCENEVDRLNIDELVGRMAETLETPS